MATTWLHLSFQEGTSIRSFSGDKKMLDNEKMHGPCGDGIRTRDTKKGGTAEMDTTSARSLHEHSDSEL